MKIELYSLPDCIHAKAIKIFLNKNNLPFKEIKVDNEKAKIEFRKVNSYNNISFLKVTYSHGIHVMQGFNEHFLNQMIEHIKKYNPRIETWQKT